MGQLGIIEWIGPFSHDTREEPSGIILFQPDRFRTALEELARILRPITREKSVFHPDSQVELDVPQSSPSAMLRDLLPTVHKRHEIVPDVAVLLVDVLSDERDRVWSKDVTLF